MKNLLGIIICICILSIPAQAKNLKIAGKINDISPILFNGKIKDGKQISLNELIKDKNKKNFDIEIDFDLSGYIRKSKINYSDDTKYQIIDDALIEEEKKNLPFPLQYLEDTRVYLLELEAEADGNYSVKKQFIGKIWELLKGEPLYNSVLLGMFSRHTSENEHNETHNLFGIDYKGYSAGTFKNSHSERTFYAGISRKLCDYRYKEYEIDIKYKLIVMHGYGDRYPNLLGMTPVIIPMLGITKGVTGVDFIVLPAKNPIFTFNFRINLPEEVLKK